MAVYCDTYTMTYEDVKNSYYMGKPIRKNQWWDEVEIEVYFI